MVVPDPEDDADSSDQDEKQTDTYVTPIVDKNSDSEGNNTYWHVIIGFWIVLIVGVLVSLGLCAYYGRCSG